LISLRAPPSSAMHPTYSKGRWFGQCAPWATRFRPLMLQIAAVGDLPQIRPAEFVGGAASCVIARRFRARLAERVGRQCVLVGWLCSGDVARRQSGGSGDVVDLVAGAGPIAEGAIIPSRSVRRPRASRVAKGLHAGMHRVVSQGRLARHRPDQGVHDRLRDGDGSRPFSNFTAGEPQPAQAPNHLRRLLSWSIVAAVGW